jgi:hypothetical protein
MVAISNIWHELFDPCINRYMEECRIKCAVWIGFYGNACNQNNGFLKNEEDIIFCKTLIEHFSVFRGYLITLTPYEWDKSYTHK